MAAKQLELQERRTAVAKMRGQADLMQVQANMQLDAEKQSAFHTLKSHNMDLKMQRFIHKQRIDKAELAVL